MLEWAARRATFGRGRLLGCGLGQVALLVQQQEGGHAQAPAQQLKLKLHLPATNRLIR